MKEEGSGAVLQDFSNTTTAMPSSGVTGNNYSRSEGQNVGNFLTDRPSSRVLAPPGGGSQITFGNEPSPQKQVRALDQDPCNFFQGYGCWLELPLHKPARWWLAINFGKMQVLACLMKTMSDV